MQSKSEKKQARLVWPKQAVSEDVRIARTLPWRLHPATAGDHHLQHHQPPPPPPTSAPLLPLPPLPALRARPALESGHGSRATPRSRSVAAKPGVVVQDRLLHDFHFFVATGLLPPRPPAHLWLTPCSLSHPSSLLVVRNSINFLLCTPPGRLRVVQVESRVFRVTVACQNVANAIVVGDVTRSLVPAMHSHPNLESAIMAVDGLQKRAGEDGHAVTAHQPARSCTKLQLSQCKARDKKAIAAQCQQYPGAENSKDLLQSFCTSTQPEATLLPAPLSPRQLPHASVTAPRPPSATPYLDALHSPSLATLSPRAKPPRPITRANACHRCLASDHTVRECRDPVRCRNCGRNGHRRGSCKMPITRVLTPFHRRRQPTIPVPASRQTVVAVPFNGRSASPATPPNPPPSSPAVRPLVPYTTTYEPSCMVASSSSSAPDFELPRSPPPATALATGTRFPTGPRARERAPVPVEQKVPTILPRAVDIRVVSTRGSVVMEPPLAPSRSTSAGRRSPPSGPEFEPMGADGRPGSVPGHQDAGNSSQGENSSFPEPPEFQFPDPSIDSGSLETVESDAFSSERSEINWEGRTQFVEAWLGPVDPAVNPLLAFAYIVPPEAIANSAGFIVAALAREAPYAVVELLPSSRGAMLLRFVDRESRDAMRALSPIAHDGAVLKLECPEETDNHFTRVPEWVAFVTVSDFPPEHWKEHKIKEAFGSCCNVAEIDPRCLTGYDYYPLRMLLELNHYLDIPSNVLVTEPGNDGRDGSYAQVMVIDVWPRAAQLDGDGRLRKFFPPLPQNPQNAHAPQPPHVPPSPPPPPSHQPPMPRHHHAGQPAAATNAAAMLALFAAFAQLAHRSLAMLRMPSLQPAMPLLQINPPGSPDPPQPASPPNSPALSAVAGPIHVRRHRVVVSNIPKRQSKRIADKAKATYENMSDKASRRKELQNNLQSCSQAVKKEVEKHNLLTRTKLPIPKTALRKLVRAAGMSCKVADSIGVVGPSTKE
ncbi:hypothetical protein BS78_04G045800 [Paspalum vaginatum]|nr:hypothetical protein BS78_04G045800 [Paspalum vaginatum]